MIDTCDACQQEKPITRTNLLPRPSDPMELVNTFATCEECGKEMGLMTYAEAEAKFWELNEQGKALFLSLG